MSSSSPNRDKECPICFSELDENNRGLKTLSCGHKVHASCMRKATDATYSGQAKCPLCRKLLTAADLRSPGRNTPPAPVARRNRADNLDPGIRARINAFMAELQQPARRSRSRSPPVRNVRRSRSPIRRNIRRSRSRSPVRRSPPLGSRNRPIIIRSRSRSPVRRSRSRSPPNAPVQRRRRRNLSRSPRRRS